MAGGHAWQGACVAGGCAWQGVCMAGGMCVGGHAWQGTCMVGGMHGQGGAWAGGHAWWGDVYGRGVCMAGGMHGWRGAWQGDMHATHAPLDTTRYGQSMRGWYAFYWNAFLFYLRLRVNLCDVSKISIVSKKIGPSYWFPPISTET